MTYLQIQNDIIRKYRVDLCNGTKCKNDWSRTHAHVKKRRVCKWKRANSFQSTFTLLHEVGHIETTRSGMRRCEEEFYATVWALERCREYGLKVPEKTIRVYQDYIDVEKVRGIRRGGVGYGDYSLMGVISRNNALERPPDSEKEKNGSVIDIPFEPGKVPVGFGGQVEYECGGGGVEVWAEIKRSPVSEKN